MTSSAHPTAVTPPPPVRLAVSLVYARIALTLLGLLLNVVYRDEIAAASSTGAGPGVAGLAAGVGVAFAVLSALVAIALWVVLAVFTGRGHGWARIVLTVFAGLAVVGALITGLSLGVTAATGFSTGVPVAVSVVQTLLSLALWAAIVVLLWRSASSAFFRAAAAARAARTAGAGHR